MEENPMLKKLLLGAFLVAIVLMVWGFIFWTFLASPFLVFSGVSNEAAVIEALDQNIAQTGVYLYPFPDMSGDSSTETFVAQHQAGPIVQIIFRKEGLNPMSPSVFVGGFIHFFVSALILGVLLLLALPGLSSYGRRLLFVVVAGLFAAILVNLSEPIWYYHPWGYHLYYAAFTLTSSLFAGLVLAWIIKPQT
jgi:hypothetical protein